MSANYTPNQNEYKNLTPFKSWLLLQINTWGQVNFPFVESDFDELTNYGMMQKLMGALNDVISNMNDVEEDVTNIFNAFTELQTYVNDYFDNLDVQDEINAKLDAMAQDGTLTQLISGYIDPIQTAFESEVRGTLGRMQNQINSVESGSPLVASSTSEMTDTSRVYVNITDGKWYYYDGDSWEIGGTYQGTQVSDNSVTLDSLGSDVKFNLNQRINEKDVYNLDGKKTIDFSDNLVNANINSTTGQIETRTDNVYFANKYSYYVPENAIIPIMLYPSWRIYVYYYDENFDYISYRDISTSGSVTCMIINLIKNAKYIKFRISKQDGTTSTINEIANAIKPELVNIYNQLKTRTGTNMFNPYKYISGYLNNTQQFPYQIQQLENTTYRTTFPIPVEGGKSYFIKRFRQFIGLDNNFNYISGTGTYADTENYIYQPVSDGYIVFSYNQPYASTEIVAQSDTPVDYVPYKEYLPDYIDLSNLTQSDRQDILYGKKYVALGDSFTHGDFANSPTNDYTILSGIYQGQYKVYPYLIGNRNNMTILNLAENGMTIANKNGSSQNYLNDSILEQIPNDVDYITIKIGINDSPDHQNVPLGTITSEDRKTFYGAWNYVVNYLITNYPNAKIGIIISNGITSLDYINAEINIAKRYGLAYYNETTDEHVPLLIRTMRTDVLQSIKTLRNQEWEVLPGTNGHPNAKCHEYESTMIESFLRSL